MYEVSNCGTYTQIGIGLRLLQRREFFYLISQDLHKTWLIVFDIKLSITLTKVDSTKSTFLCLINHITFLLQCKLNPLLLCSKLSCGVFLAFSPLR
jgi:hypothetical protein